MVICIIALPVFALLGLFSLKYRMLAGEAFRCLFKTIQLEPCDSGLDQRIKSKFSAKLMWWPAFARFFYKNFALLSWIFVILMIVSAGFSGYGFYNFLKYGNCNGPDSSAFCIFNPTAILGDNQCSTFAPKGEVNLSKVIVDGARVRGNSSTPYFIIEYGCYSCEYTKKAEPVVRQILEDYPNVKLLYLDVPLEIHEYSVGAGKATICAGRQGRFWEMHDLILDRTEESSMNLNTMVGYASQLKMDVIEFIGCTQRNSSLEEVNQMQKNALFAGVYGTPTFIIGDQIFVGPQDYKTLKKAVEKEINSAR